MDAKETEETSKKTKMLSQEVFAYIMPNRSVCQEESYRGGNTRVTTSPTSPNMTCAVKTCCTGVRWKKVVSAAIRVPASTIRTMRPAVPGSSLMDLRMSTCTHELSTWVWSDLCGTFCWRGNTGQEFVPFFFACLKSASLLASFQVQISGGRRMRPRKPDSRALSFRSWAMLRHAGLCVLPGPAARTPGWIRLLRKDVRS